MPQSLDDDRADISWVRVEKKRKKERKKNNPIDAGVLHNSGVKSRHDAAGGGSCRKVHTSRPFTGVGMIDWNHSMCRAAAGTKKCSNVGRPSTSRTFSSRGERSLGQGLLRFLLFAEIKCAQSWRIFLKLYVGHEISIVQALLAGWWWLLAVGCWLWITGLPTERHFSVNHYT